MKKNKFVILFITMFMLNCGNVLADSINISSNAKSIVVGKSVDVTATVSSSTPLVSIEGTLNCSGAGSGSVSMSFDDSSNSIKSKSFTLTVKGNSAGTISCKVNSGRITNMSSDSWINLSSNTLTITVNNANSNSGGSTNNGGSTTPKATVKSSINYLSSLSIEGVELSPAFDKETTEYDVTLEAGTNSVIVNGTKESSVSYVTGLGDVTVSEGVNFISVVVTAENGAKRTYNIRATVLEESPIIVNVNGSDKTLIRKALALPSASDYYVLSSISIDDVEIPAYVSEITGYTLVGLKDDSGNVSLYRYDNNSYLEYNEFGFNSIRISLLDTDIPKGYSLGSITIGEKEYPAYLKDGAYPLIYGVNLETGESNFYSYDSSENTIQKFVLSDVDDLSKYYPYIIVGLCGLALFEFFVIICVAVSKNKKLKKALRNKLDTKTLYEKSFESKKNSVYKDEENITDDLTDEYLSSESDEELGHTALISKSVSNVYNNSKNKKEQKKKKKNRKKNDDDEMFHF